MLKKKYKSRILSVLFEKKVCLKVVCWMYKLVEPQIDENEVKVVEQILKSHHVAEGKYSREFEARFSEFVGVKRAVTVANGTAALHIAWEALGLAPGDEVITTAFTFIASANSISFVGGIPRFADIDPYTLNLDPDKVERMITPRTRAIMPVHIFGVPSDMKRFREIADEHGLFLVEDAAQAHGAKIDGQHVGTFGDIACFSFYATKNVATGEGGMIVTNDEDLADRCEAIKNHGRDKKGGYRHYRIGYNLRSTDIAAAIGIEQLKKLPWMLKVRARNVQIIKSYLADLSEVVTFQKIKPGVTPSNYILALLLKTDKITVLDVIKELKKRNIAARPIYDVPCYRQPAYQHINEWRWAKYVSYPDYTQISLPNTEYAATHHFEVPIHPGVSEEDAHIIGENLQEIFQKL